MNVLSVSAWVYCSLRHIPVQPSQTCAALLHTIGEEDGGQVLHDLYLISQLKSSSPWSPKNVIWDSWSMPHGNKKPSYRFAPVPGVGWDILPHSLCPQAVACSRLLSLALWWTHSQATSSVSVIVHQAEYPWQWHLRPCASGTCFCPPPPTASDFSPDQRVHSPQPPCWLFSFSRLSSLSIGKNSNPFLRQSSLTMLLECGLLTPALWALTSSPSSLTDHPCSPELTWNCPR